MIRRKRPLGVMPTYLRDPQDVDTVVRAVDSFADSCDADLLLVDDASPAPELVDEVAAKSRVNFDLVRKVENTGFSQTVNVGLERALKRKRDAVLVNADMVFHEEGWLDRMLATDAWVVGARLLYPSGLIQHAGIYYSLLRRDFGHIYQFGPADLPEALTERVCPVTGACQLIRYECMSELGVYDPLFAMSFEDVDYCLRVWQHGKRVVYQPEACALHHESMFRGRPSKKIEDWQHRSLIRLMRKWAGVNFVEFVPALV